MDSSLKVNYPNSKRPSKALIFDRRYGWVFDEWKDPSEQALEGSRGMFCVLPLAKALLKTASQTIDSAANTAVKVLESPNSLSPEVLQTSINDQLHKIASSVKKLELNMMKFKKNFRWELTTSNLHGESHKTPSCNP
ncbi:PREDICTED: uncharacterized protein LOC109160142 [Ipomoea nil]|uniref:uncharacterized protein LOC109160142 n=1 Tax=Ipomoea nil TaxID=35883 RepID=UPI00090087AB|nr:PREDICTED: uncharacterized protein LOC109160142 [Ipomoea nil]